MNQLPKHDIHAPHSGRAGGNALNPKHASHIGRELLSHLVSGHVVITNSEPPFNPGDDAAGIISAELTAVENGSVKLLKLEGFPVAEAGQHRADGVRVTWENKDGTIVSRRVDWRLA